MPPLRTDGVSPNSPDLTKVETPMSDDIPLAINPVGTIGVGVIDGAYGEASSTEAIRQEVQAYLSRSGLNTSPMPFKGMGSATGDILLAVGTGIVTDVLIHLWLRARTFLSAWRDRTLKRRFRAHRKECHIQFGDRRDGARDAVELLLLLPELQDHLAQAYPNRTYSFVIFSATPSIEFVEIILKDYDSLQRSVRQMARIIQRMPVSKFLSLHLEDGAYGSRRVTYNVV